MIHSVMCRFQTIILAAAACLLFPAAAHAVLTVTPTQMIFVQGTLGQAPPAQTISITSTTGPINAPVTSGASWLGVTVLTSLNSPVILSVSANPVGLDPGTYNATITISSATDTPSPIVVNVSLTVNTSPPSSVTPTQLTFVHTEFQPFPPAQLVQVNAPAGTISVTVSESWLIASAPTLSTPAQISVSVNPTNLPPGLYSGVITITFSTTPISFQLVSVTLQVGAGASLWTTSGPITFFHRFGDPMPDSQRLNVSHASVITFTATPASSGWLRVDPPAAVTPAVIAVSADPTGLLAGTYNGTITLSSISTTSTTVVSVTLIVTGSPSLSASPNILDFQAPSGGLPPPSRTVTITSTPAIGIRTEIVNAPWLSVSPTTGTTPQVLTITANPASLAPGTYRGSVVISATGATSGGQLISVTFVVTAGAPLTVSPASFRFEATANGAAPPVQTLSVTSATPAAIALATSPGWLVVTPASGTTPANFSVSVVIAGLAPGIHTGRITVTAPGSTLALQTVEVVLNIGSAAPTIVELSNGAGLMRDFAPGSVIILYGREFGPAIGRTATAIPGGIVATNLADVQVFVNGIAVPLLYVSATQINAMIPFEVAGQPNLQIRVVYQGVSSQTVTAPLAATAPILFTADGSGRGQAAVLNQTGFPNSPNTPAIRGSVVSFFAAGGGLFNPPLQTGSVTERAGPPPQAESAVFIGGIQAVLLYAGPAPGTVAGILQFNAYVSEQVIPGPAVNVTLKIGDGFSPTGATIAVQ